MKENGDRDGGRWGRKPLITLTRSARIFFAGQLREPLALSRAAWKSPELRVRGTVSRLPNGLYADSVDLHTGTSDGTNCTGPRLATVGIDPAGDGSFEFRLRNVATNPQNACVKSLGGGVDDIPVALG